MPTEYDYVVPVALAGHEFDATRVERVSRAGPGKCKVSFYEEAVRGCPRGSRERYEFVLPIPAGQVAEVLNAARVDAWLECGGPEPAELDPGPEEG